MLDAGAVTTELRFKMDPSGALKYDAAIKQVIAKAAAAEAKVAAAQSRLTAGQQRLSEATHRAAEAGARFGEAVPLKAMDQWEKNSAKASQNLQTLGRVGTKTAAVGFLALGAATIYAVSKATTFNREMLKVSTQAGGSAKEVANLKAQVLGLAGQVPQGPQQLAEGLYHIESAGFRGAKAIDILKAAAMGAALGNASLEETSNAVVGAIASQIKGAKDGASAMGVLNQIVGIGNMRFEELDKAIGTGVLPTFAQAGLTITDFGAALATVTDNSTPANVTATRLRMTIAQMVSPTKAAAKELAKIGLTSTSLATDLRQPNGLLVAVEDLKKHLKDSGKSAIEQDQILSNSFGRGKSSAIIMTLVQELGRLKTKYDELGKSNGPQKLSQAWAQYQKSASAGFEELKSGAEAFAITIGEVLSPEMTKLAHEGTKAFEGFIKGGGAKQAGHDIEQAFSTLGSAVSHLAPSLEAAAKALYDVGNAAGLANSSELATLAGTFLAFKAASFVAPIIVAIGSAISYVALSAYTASSLSAFALGLTEVMTPAGVITGVLTVAAAAFIALKSGLFDSASAAEQYAAALQKATDATKELNEASEGAAKAGIAHQRAMLEKKEAAEGLKKVEGEIADKTLKGTAAEDARTRARLRYAEASQRAAASGTEVTAAQKKEETSYEKQQRAVEGRTKKLWDELNALEQGSHGKRKQASIDQERVKLRAAINREDAKNIQLQGEAAVAQESRFRQERAASLSAGDTARITKQNAQGVAALQRSLLLSGAEPKVVTKYELDDQGAQAKLGHLAAQLESIGKQAVVAKVLTTAPTAAVAIAAFKAIIAGVPAAKVIRILHNAHSAKQAMSELGSAVRGIPASKLVTISINSNQAVAAVQSIQSAIDGLHGVQLAVNILQTTTQLIKKATGHASGRGRGSDEAALVGEGRGREYVIDASTGNGQVIDRPTLMGLSPSDYVVPLEDRYRGRALGLFAMLARDLDIPGFKAGKKGKSKGQGHKHHALPPLIDALSLPLSDIEGKEQKAHSDYDSAHSRVKSLGKKAKKSDLARERKAQVKMERLQTDVREAKHYQGLIDQQTALANIAANDMRLADGRGDDAGYQTAKGKRVAAITKLQELLAGARKHVKGGSAYFRTLTEQLGAAEIQGQEAGGEEPPALTPEQEKVLKGLEASEAVAALTPGLADDTAAAQQVASFLEGALGQAEARGAGSDAIKELAERVSTARSNLTSLLGGGGSNENQDVQAQIEQERQRTESERQGRETAERALRVLTGSGDIGSGGANAQAAVIQHNYMLHPSDPAVLKTIGDAATAGIGYQGGRRSPRVRMGPP